MGKEEPRASRSGKHWQNPIGWFSFLTFSLFMAWTVLLVCFRSFHFFSDDFSILLMGYHIGVFLRVILFPALLFQIIALLAGWGVYRTQKMGQVGAIGGLVMFFIMAVLWMNLSEILIDDLRPSVQKNITNAAIAAEVYYDKHAAYPDSLDIIGGTSRTLILRDPYSPNRYTFSYEHTKHSLLLLSNGPDGDRDLLAGALLSDQTPGLIIDCQYDSTNGIRSNGDIIRYSRKSE